MSIDTYVQRARRHVRSEREAASAKREAFDAFVDEVRDVATASANASSAGVTTAGVQRRGTSANESRCRAVRTAFAETVRPHSVDDLDGDESLLETIRAEFTEPIAVALAPTTAAAFTDDLRERVVAEARARRTETAAFERALDREADQLDEAAETVDEVVGWLVDADETPLTDLGFDALARRHERLAARRARCEEVAERRQAFLEATTSNGAEAGVRHRQLLAYLYDDFAVDHPVLATVADLDATCMECQRAVRDHLTRRT